MRLLVTDVTRMAEGYICVAGIDMATGGRVRPTLGGARLPSTMLSVHGGPFDLRRVIDLGIVMPDGGVPEVEDVRFWPDTMRVVATLDGPEFMARLAAAVAPGVRTAIGPELVPRGTGGLVVPAGKDACSLVVTRARAPFDLALARCGSPRAHWPNGIDLSVTDIRLYQRDHRTPDERAL